MADSVKQQIVGAFTTILSGISGVGMVSPNLKNWEEMQPQDFPAAFPVDEGDETERWAYPHGTSDDMATELIIIVWCYVYDKYGETAQKKFDFERSVILAVEADPTLGGLVLDVYKSGADTDAGVVPKHRIFNIRFRVRYDYNHLVP